MVNVIFWRTIMLLIVAFVVISIVRVIMFAFLPEVVEEESTVNFDFLKRTSITMFVSIILLMAFLKFDAPVPGEYERMEFILSNYKEHGTFYRTWLVYDEEIGQYKYCCFDDEANLIGLTAPLDSEIIRLPDTDYLAEPYHVEILSYEVRTKLTHMPVTHITHQIFYIPDDEYAIIDHENLAKFK